MADHEAPTITALGGSLVIGGCGFLGYHLVRHLLDGGNALLRPVYVLDRNVDNNRVPGVTAYTQGSITDAAAVRDLLRRLRPLVVFHMASPLASLPASRKQEFHETNVAGTSVLLAEAAACDAVEAFVYTSTVDVYADPPHDSVDETHPLVSEKPTTKTTEYCRTKAVGDGLVRAANGPRLRTVCLRPGHVYGERHTQGLYEILDAVRGSTPLVQLGRWPADGPQPMMEVASADNTATAHVLAAKALLDRSRRAGTGADAEDDSGRVDGEAFNVSDGAPVPFWHHVRVIWGVARGADALQRVWVVPVWAMAALVAAAEWGFWACTLGRVEPPVALTRASLSYCTETHTYSVDKARKRLGFVPVVAHDEVLAESVRWELAKRGQPVRG